MCFEIWDDYYKTKSKELKDKLITKYLYLVKKIGLSIVKKMPATVDKNDIISYGMIGLIKAVESFDPYRGFKFETYATYKIKSAILDEIRALDWVPRLIRRQSRQILEIHSKLERELKRTPYDTEMCKALKINEQEYYKLLADIAPVVILDMDWVLICRDESLSIGETIKGNNLDPLEIVNYKEIRKILKDILETMTESERLVFNFYTFEDLTMKEIGAILGISESRVCQIHTKVILVLRSKFLRLLK